MGGYIIKYYQMDCRDILKLSVFLVGMSFCFCFTFLISCPNPEFAGVSTPYSERYSCDLYYVFENVDVPYS